MDDRIELNGEKLNVLGQIEDFVRGNDHVFILRGSAGTGKTTLLGEIVRWLRQVNIPLQLMAPTGRAATILKSKTGVAATTIHRGIYDFDNLLMKRNQEDDLSDMDLHFNFPLRDNSVKRVCIVDEGSMISNRLIEGELWTFGTSRVLNDLLTYVFQAEGSKLIVVGDPVQLPPVGENRSQALCDDFYAERGLSVLSADLNDVMRQSKGSIILKNAEMVRKMSINSVFNKLVFEQDEDFRSICEDEYLNMVDEGAVDKTICYSNKSASDYNRVIRERTYGSDRVLFHEGETLIVTSNHYDRSEENLPPLDVMNGEMVTVTKVLGEEEFHRNIPVYVRVDGVMSKVHIDLGFVDVMLKLPDGRNQKFKLLTQPLLDSDKGSLEIAEIKALYIDFCMRVGFRPGSIEFKNAIVKDPYINALKVKYGYAITCHKAQGGEWRRVVVDFDGLMINQDKIRWIYTAITRSSGKLYMLNAPSVTPDKTLTFYKIIKTSKMHEAFPQPVIEAVESPFHKADAPSFLKAKYAEVKAKMDTCGFKILNVFSSNYLERYIVDLGEGVQDEINFWYNGKNVFTRTGCKNERLVKALESEVQTCNEVRYPDFQYKPALLGADALWTLMIKSTESCDIKIVAVKEYVDSYSIDYLLKTSGNHSWIKFYVTAKGMLTTAMPYTDIDNDQKLQTLIDFILTQRCVNASASSLPE